MPSLRINKKDFVNFFLQFFLVADAKQNRKYIDLKLIKWKLEVAFYIIR